MILKLMEIFLFFSVLAMILAFADYHYDGITRGFLFKLSASALLAIVAYGISFIGDKE
jgi:hypothetical protein